MSREDFENVSVYCFNHGYMGGKDLLNYSLDTDGDSVPDNADAFPLDASETLDTDGDGVGDNADSLPS